MNGKMNCPNCKTKLKRIKVEIEDAETKVTNYQCDKCGYFTFKPETTIKQKIMDESKKMLAIELYKEKNFSLGLASRVAGLSLSEFIDLLKEFNITLNLEKEDVKQALRYAREML